MPKTAPLKFLFNAFLAHHRYDKRGASAMIIIDLEWNSGSDYSGFDEILQIGAVRISAPGGCILDTFNVHVRPCVNTTLHTAAAILPELWHSFADGVCFPVAFLKFLESGHGTRKTMPPGARKIFVFCSKMYRSGICRLCPFVLPLISSVVLGSGSA